MLMLISEFLKYTLFKNRERKKEYNEYILLYYLLNSFY